MMGQPIYIAARPFVVVECCACGVEFAAPKILDDTWHRDGRMFYCPNGHEQHYTKTLAMILAETRKDRDEAIAARDKAEAEVRRLKDRAHHGVCAFCHRSFKNVQRHMATKHAEKTSA